MAKFYWLTWWVNLNDFRWFDKLTVKTENGSGDRERTWSIDTTIWRWYVTWVNSFSSSQMSMAVNIDPLLAGKNTENAILCIHQNNQIWWNRLDKNSSLIFSSEASRKSLVSIDHSLLSKKLLLLFKRTLELLSSSCHIWCRHFNDRFANNINENEPGYSSILMLR